MTEQNEQEYGTPRNNCFRPVQSQSILICLQYKFIFFPKACTMACLQESEKNKEKRIRTKTRGLHELPYTKIIKFLLVLSDIL